MRPGHVDRAPLRRAIEQVHLEVEPVGEVPQPGVGPPCAARGRGEEPLPRTGASEQPVVHHVPGLVQREHVSRATHRQVVGAAREHAVDQGVGVGSGDRELAQRADVHQAHPLTHRAVLLAPVAVAERAQPPARAIEPCARGHMDIVERRSFVDDLVHAGGERLQGHRPGRRPRGGAGHVARRRRRRPGALSREARQRPAAHRPLARAHRGGRVPLQDLGVAVALIPGLLEVVHRDVLAQAHRSLVAAGAGDVGSQRRVADHGDGLARQRHPREPVARREPEREHQHVAVEPLPPTVAPQHHGPERRAAPGLMHLAVEHDLAHPLGQAIGELGADRRRDHLHPGVDQRP